jgi:hypothetical protein
MKEIGAQLEADARCTAMHETFGHLGPTAGQHAIEILFTYTAYGEVVIIDDRYTTIENSPWQFEAFNDLIWELVNPNGKNGEKPLEKGKVYKFIGTITWGQVDSDVPAWGDALGVTNWEGEVNTVLS